MHEVQRNNWLLVTDYLGDEPTKALWENSIWVILNKNFNETLEPFEDYRAYAEWRLRSKT